MENVSDELDPVILEELKEYIHVLTADDDNNLKRLLKTAHSTLIRWCGSFGLENEEGKQLVYDYVRYMRAGVSEYFYQNFKSQIISFGFGLMEVPKDDEISEEE